MAGVQGNQVTIDGLVMGHAGNNADSQAQPNIGLDDVRIAGGKHHFWFQALGAESALEGRLAVEAEDVGDQRVVDQVVQRDLAVNRRQWMAFGNDVLEVLCLLHLYM